MKSEKLCSYRKSLKSGQNSYLLRIEHLFIRANIIDFEDLLHVTTVLHLMKKMATLAKEGMLVLNQTWFEFTQEASYFASLALFLLKGCDYPQCLFT